MLLEYADGKFRHIKDLPERNLWFTLHTPALWKDHSYDARLGKTKSYDADRWRGEQELSME